MVSLCRVLTRSGPTTAVRMGGQYFMLPGAPDPVALLMEAGTQPGAVAALLGRRWPGWQESPMEEPELGLPLAITEVWASGVTYERSRAARMDESDTPDVYDRIYTAERPEIFFKDNGRRTVGPGQPIGIRGDSNWSVPEPELTAILDSAGTILGYTIGNDVSARDIEGANPLYLPQAKIYAGSCALGPVIVPAAEIDPYKLVVRCRVLRQGAVEWEAETNTSTLKRKVEELVGYLLRYNPIPDGTALMTGTGLVPPDDLSLRDGDMVELEISGIGFLGNPVRVLR